MKFRIFCLLLITSQFSVAQSSRNMPIQDKITIDAELPPGYEKKTIVLGAYPVPSVTMKSEDEFSIEQKAQSSGSNKWEIPGNKPLYIFGDFVAGPKNILNYIAEPGDNIQISYDKNNNPVFSGNGAGKYEMITRIAQIIDSFNKLPEFRTLSSPFHGVPSFQDYLNWNNFLNRQLATSEEVLEKFKPVISSFALIACKESVYNMIETTRVLKFNSLRANKEDPSRSPGINQFGLSNKDICTIYDTTLNGPAANWIEFKTTVVNFPLYYYLRSSADAHRLKGKFFKEKESDTSIIGAEKVDGYVFRYNLVKRKYRGIIKEAALAFFFHYPRGILYSAGLDPKVEDLLKDYYATSKYPEYARAVKEFEMKVRERKTGIRDLGFTLTSVNDDPVEKSKLNGKINLMDFWFTGCTGCVQMVPALRLIEKEFEGEDGVQFVNVSIDKNKTEWLTSLKNKKYTTATGLSLYTGGLGADHPIINNNLITGYPSIILFDSYGRSISPKSYVDPRRDSGKSLIAVIRKELNLINDGPYIFHLGEKIMQAKFSPAGKEQTNIRAASTIMVNFSKDSLFEVTLKKEIITEPATYPMPEKMLALSDIEGNFSSLKNLLLANKIIDNNFNWTFGNGHLVFIGDMFDRGQQVTQCLWLLYALEAKAISAGGYVHFILGNHEIMNMQGDNRYTQIKYKQNAAQLDMSLKELYNGESELGKWLRSKNIIERIGDFLFVHGGISRRINELKLTPEGINSLARPYYSSYNEDEHKNNKVLSLVMNDKNGIFWNRSYYLTNEKEAEKTINETLDVFSVKHIVTGHTLLEGGINVKFSGKLFNTDTRHAQGESEALLYEDGIFYAINQNGVRRILHRTK